MPVLSRYARQPLVVNNQNEVTMSSNKGIGDYIGITLISAIIGFDKFGLDWLGFKAVLFTNAIVIGYAILLYIVTVIAEKFKR